MDIAAPIVLEVKDLHAYLYTRWGVVRAVDGVSFALREGETLGLVGESGCGKTMTGLSVLRLLPEPAGRIVQGQVLLEGEDLVTKSEAEMRRVRGRRISMILQDPQTSLNPVFTIGDQLVEALRMLHVDGKPALGVTLFGQLAVVGSSAMSTRGSPATAMAPTTRCFMPPLI